MKAKRVWTVSSTAEKIWENERPIGSPDLHGKLFMGYPRIEWTKSVPGPQ